MPERSSVPEVRLTRVFDAPRRLVFEAWTKAEHVARWFGPEGFTIPDCVVDFRPGGTFRFVLRGPDGNDYPFDGKFEEIVVPERIVFTGRIHDDNDSRTTVTFTEHDGKTTLTVHQSYTFASDATRGAPIGWGQTLDHLAAFVAKR